MAESENIVVMKPVKDHVQGFCKFADEGASPFHAVANVAERLSAHGFEFLNERNDWDIRPNGKYYFTRNQSILVAFAVGGQFKPGNSFTILGAHTNSPCLVLKPNSKVRRGGYNTIGVQCYG